MYTKLQIINESIHDENRIDIGLTIYEPKEM